MLLEILLNSLTFRVSLSLNTDLGLHKITAITAMITNTSKIDGTKMNHILSEKKYKNMTKLQNIVRKNLGDMTQILVHCLQISQS